MNMKIIEYWYFLSIGAVVAGVYLMIVYIIIGDVKEAIDQSLYTGMLTASTLWFRDRFNLKP